MCAWLPDGNTSLLNINDTIPLFHLVGAQNLFDLIDYLGWLHHEAIG
jgi:hypothetical protein